MAKFTAIELRKLLEAMSDELLGSRMRSLLFDQPDDAALGRYFRSILDQMTDEELVEAVHRNQRAQFVATQQRAKA